VIAEVVSLSGYESQVAALLDEEERMVMEFFIACAPEDHPVRVPEAFAKPAGPSEGRERAAAFAWFTSS
jgi:hypothetical protein